SRRSFRSVFGLAGLAAALALATSMPAVGQGAAGRVPDPRGGKELDRWLDDADVPESDRDAIFEIHARYLAEVERLRDREIEAWLREAPVWWGSGDVEQTRQKLEAARGRIAEQRRLLARLEALEERLWSEIGSTTAVPSSTVESLRQRARLDRLSDLGRHYAWRGNGATDLATLIAAAKATPAEAARIREVLAGHDATVVKVLEEQRDLALEAEVRQLGWTLEREERWAEMRRLADEEMQAAAQEGREAQVQEIYESFREDPTMQDESESEKNRLLARLARQQLAAIRAIEPILGDTDRLAGVMVATGVVPGGMDDFYEMFEEMGREGAVTPSQLAAIGEIRRRSIANEVPNRLEIAELEIRRLELPGNGWTLLEDGTYAESPESAEINARLMELQGGESMQEQMQIVVSIGQIVGAKTFGDIMRQWGRKQGIPEQFLEPMIAQLVAGIEAGAIDGERMQQEMMARMWSPPPSWKVIDEATLAAILDDLGVEGEMRLVASQLIEDGAPRFEEALAAATSEIETPDPEDAEAMQQFLMRRMGGREATELAAIDAGLDRVLAADRAFFDDLVGVLGAEVEEPLRPWRAVRQAELIAGSEMAQGPAMVVSNWMDPSAGNFERVASFTIALEAIPEALRDPAVRAAFAAHAEEIAGLRRERRDSMRSLGPRRAAAMATAMALQEELNAASAADAAMSQADMERQQRNQQELAAIERETERWSGAVGNRLRQDLARLQAVLDPESARAFRRAVLREAWRQELGSPSGLESLERARERAIAAGDAARVAEADAMIESYDAASDRLLDLLWTTSEDVRANGSPKTMRIQEGVEQVDTSRWWPSAAGRAKFRQAELDFAVMRAVDAP
ncbi:MAG: hypothetical protein ACO3ZY_08480, partial [Phycisphaerales bacterium]